MQTLLLVLRRLCIACALLYAASISVLAVLWSVDAPRTWWIVLSNIFALYAFVPLAVLVPVALLLRSRAMGGAALAALLAFGLLFGPQLLPRPAPSVPATLRLVSFNQLFSNQQVDAVVAAIRAQNADVVALQELSSPVAAAIAQQLRQEYPYQSLQPERLPTGLGVISRFPLQTQPVLADARHQTVRIAVRDQTVTLINVHPRVPQIERRGTRDAPLWRKIRGYDTSNRSQDLGAVLAEVDRTSGPLLVVGDMNLSDREPMYRDFAARLHDAFRDTNWGFGMTFPNHGMYGPVTIPVPLVRIDYVWSGGGITPVQTQVDCRQIGSDHCMLVADMAL